MGKTQVVSRLEGSFTPFFGVVTLTFAVLMLLFAVIGWTQFSAGSLVTIVSMALCAVGFATGLGLLARPDLARRVGLGAGVLGTLLVLPFVIGGLVALGDGRMPHPEKVAALASIGLVCSIYAVFAGVALAQERRRRTSPAATP